MASGTNSITVRVYSRLSIAWIRAMRWAAYVIGPTRAYRLAEWGAMRLLLIRFDNGPWRPFRAYDR